MVLNYILVAVPLNSESPECIHNSAVHDEAFTMCFIRKFKRKRLNLLTDSKEKRWVFLQSCFLSITIFRWINSFPAPKYGFYHHFRAHVLSVSWWKHKLNCEEKKCSHSLKRTALSLPYNNKIFKLTSALIVELLSVAPRATLTPLSCSSNFPRA